MKARRALLVIPVAALVGIAAAALVRARQADAPILGFHDCAPALFRKLPAGEVAVAISDIRYDSSGRIAGYVEEYTAGGSKPVRSTIAVTRGEGDSCATTTYAVEMNGRSLRSEPQGTASSSKQTGIIGFRAEQLGGIVFVGSVEGEFTTSFAYDSFGRRMLARQVFRPAGARPYEITYSAVTFDSFGRLSAYRAALKPKL
jgi:hypothetical protein